MKITRKHLRISTTSPEPYYSQIEKKFTSLITANKILPDQQLPSEKEIGEMCGVSRVTVRQAVDNLEKNGLVYRLHGKGTYAGKKPDVAKKNNATQKIITILLPQVNQRLHPYTLQLIQGVEHQANNFGFTVSISTDLNSLCNNSIPSGVILPTRIPAHELRQLQEKNIPFVLTVENEETYGYASYPTVQLDNRKAGYMQAQYLVDLGHRRIALFSGSLKGALKGEGNKRRIDGYKSALEQSQLCFDECLIKECNYEPEKTIAMTEELLSSPQPPTAIMAADDIGAGIIINFLREKNIRVPEDISVMGMGDLGISAAISPALTTYQIPVFQIGEKAFSMLYQVMQNEAIQSPLYSYGELVIRKSCAENVS